MLLMRVRIIKEALKRYSVGLVGILLIVNTMGCTHGSLDVVKKKREVEVWLIDSKELLLYRILKSGEEQIIPLKSKSMDRFMCVDKQVAKELISDSIKE